MMKSASNCLQQQQLCFTVKHFVTLFDLSFSHLKVQSGQPAIRAACRPGSPPSGQSIFWAKHLPGNASSEQTDGRAARTDGWMDGRTDGRIYMCSVVNGIECYFEKPSDVMNVQLLSIILISIYLSQIPLNKYSTAYTFHRSCDASKSHARFCNKKFHMLNFSLRIF